MAASLYLLAVLLPAVLGQCTVEKATPAFTRAVYEFSLDLVQRLGQETNNHFVASPLSLWTILSTVSVGADGVTLEEIKKTLRRHDLKCFNKRYLDIVGRIISATDETTLERSSVVFIDETQPVHQFFLRRLNRTGLCDVMICPFEDFQILEWTINNYISRVTHWNIREVVSRNDFDFDEGSIMLIDAIYFKGAWSQPFDPARTEQNALFYDERNITTGSVNMMQSLLPLQTRAIDSIEANVLELPYGTQGRFSMLIFLPYPNNTVAGVIDHLKHEPMRSIFHSLNESPVALVKVGIPRFTISSNFENLKELLQDMGLMAMFDSSKAQFPFISDHDLYVSNVVQKAEIMVTESGTEASAASVLDWSGKWAKQFTANKPFLYMIVDTYFNIPLFTGAYSKPST